jgi:TPR repeat protein
MSSSDQGTPETSRPYSGGGLPPDWQPPDIELRILSGPVPGRRDLRCWIGGIILLFILTAFAAPYLQERPGRDLPPALRPWYERARGGDASAMRVLGSMYCQGQNVPQDLAEGMRWYHLAMAAGSLEAVKDMEYR